MSNKGWECPVCHIGLAPTCQACPECIRKKNSITKGSAVAVTGITPSITIEPMVNPNIGTTELTFTEGIGKPYTTTSQSNVITDIDIN